MVAAVLEEYGAEVWGVLVDRLFGLGEELAGSIGRRRGQGWELAMVPQSNIVCFRLVPEEIAAGRHNAFTTALRQRHLEEGAHYVVQTRFNGAVWLRCTLMNPLTEPEDLEAMLDGFEVLAKEMLNQGWT